MTFPPGSLLAALYAEDDNSKGPVYANRFDTIVTMGFLRACPDFKVALKKVDKSRIWESGHLKRCAAEADILRRMAHKHVVPVLDAVETDNLYLTIMPYADSGSLFTHTQHKTATEYETRNFVSQALEAICWVHSKGWLHGDIKPHNFLLSRVDGKFVVQLCDFGISDPVRDGVVPFTTLRGTSGYFAPEQINHEDYGLGVDIFAFGVVVHQLLVGYEPFDPPSKFEDLDFDPRYWKPMSKEVQHFISGLLHLAQAKRLTADAARKHPWTSIEISEEQQVEKFVPPPDFSVKFHPASSCPDIFTLPPAYLTARETAGKRSAAEDRFPNPNDPDEEFKPAPRTFSSGSIS